MAYFMKWNLQSAKVEFDKKGLTLLSNEYKNYDEPMECIALCGCIKKLSLSNLVIGHGLRCKKHSSTYGSSKRKHLYEDVKKKFEEEGCKLISTEYVKNDSKLEYIPRCGHESVITFNKFLSGQGRICGKCSRPRREKHHKYNSKITDEERINNRDYYAIYKWRNDVYERDNYTCKVCGDSKGGNLEAHHLNGYNWDEENRLNLENGVTLCKLCHTDFHKSYGFGHNTKEQYEKWLMGIPR